MPKVYIPTTGPDDWQRFLTDPVKQWLSLAKIKNTSKINNIRRGCVTCSMDDVQRTRRFGE